MIIYDFLYKAYKYYNQKLFENKLPERIVITIERRSNIKGYFSSSRFSDQRENDVLSQITLNPSYFGKGDEKKVLSTLVHEMCHLYMDMSGEKLSQGYHSKKWASWMENIGLLPTDNGMKDGKKTGFRMTHLIIKGGKFDEVTKLFLNQNSFDVIEKEEDYIGAAEKDVSGFRKKNGTRIRYSCGCSLIWGKKGLNIICGKCGNKFEESSKEA